MEFVRILQYKMWFTEIVLFDKFLFFIISCACSTQLYQHFHKAENRIKFFPFIFISIWLSCISFVWVSAFLLSYLKS